MSATTSISTHQLLAMALRQEVEWMRIIMDDGDQYEGKPLRLETCQRCHRLTLHLLDRIDGQEHSLHLRRMKNVQGGAAPIYASSKSPAELP